MSDIKIPEYLLKCVGKELELERDLVDKDQRRIGANGAKYKILDVSAYPNPFCFLVINDQGCINMMHMSNFKAPIKTLKAV